MFVMPIAPTNNEIAAIAPRKAVIIPSTVPKIARISSGVKIVKSGFYNFNS